MSDMRHMLDLIGGPCPHGKQPAVECAMCARAEVTALKARVAELEKALTRISGGNFDCPDDAEDIATTALSGSPDWLATHDEEVRAKAIEEAAKVAEEYRDYCTDRAKESGPGRFREMRQIEAIAADLVRQRIHDLARSLAKDGGR